ncbi:small, acid-soluble spore protein, alpha/beta type [Geosporobacter ferrireducens]|uniref:small, acid-soluble spore protein, alpha/beta type n=1 Tax=Geosporobacter ferrireducens TaxID=1424294 RepID=UPI001472112D|nr:small, acid-soluble spore protein, alpha/beta type [Geosporobacter ferrireducens]
MKNSITNPNARQALDLFKEEIASELGIDNFVYNQLSSSSLKTNTRNKVEDAYTHLGRS